MKKFLFLALLALFVLLSFSCSGYEGFKSPDGQGSSIKSCAKDGECEPCVLNDRCFQTSLSACTLMGGRKAEAEDCLDTSIVNIDFSISNGEVAGWYLVEGKITVDSTSSKNLDSIKIQGYDSNNEPFEVFYYVDLINNPKEYVFKSGPGSAIEIHQAEIKSCGLFKVCVDVYALDVTRPWRECREFEKPASYCPVSSSSSGEVDVSSSSGEVDVSSSSGEGDVSSSSGEGDSSSSGEVDVSSSSGEGDVTGNYPVVPDFTCKWDSTTVTYGNRVTPISTLTINDPFCSLDSVYTVSGTKFKIDEVVQVVNPKFPREGSFNVIGKITCSNAGREGSRTKACAPLTITPRSAPVVAELTLKPSYKYETKDYFYSGVAIRDSVVSRFATEDECANITYRIEPATAVGANGRTIVTDTLLPIKVFVNATCAGIPYNDLDSISTAIVPDPSLKGCELDSGSYKYMARSETLKVKTVIEKDIHNRCTSEYRFSSQQGQGGGAWSPSNSYDLSSRPAGNPADMNNIVARITCNGNTTPEVRCPSVTVANNKYTTNPFEGDEAGMSGTVASGISVIEINNPPYRINMPAGDTSWVRTIGCGDFGNADNDTYRLYNGTAWNPVWAQNTNPTTTNSNIYWKETLIPTDYRTNGNRFLIENTSTGAFRCVVYYRNPG